MILHVLDRALAARRVSRAILATDDQRIIDAAHRAGYEAILTRADHHSGTDRVAEVAQQLKETELIVNVQGDEPFIDPLTIDLAVEALIEDKEAVMATSSEAMTSKHDVLSPDVVKVVSDPQGNALYFSRSPIPYPRDAVRRHESLSAALDADPALLQRFRKHTGLYVYRRNFLLQYTNWPPADLEQTESLEQLRALAHGAKIKVIEAATPSIGVDTPEDLERVNKMMEIQFRQD